MRLSTPRTLKGEGKRGPHIGSFGAQGDEGNSTRTKILVAGDLNYLTVDNMKEDQ